MVEGLRGAEAALLPLPYPQPPQSGYWHCTTKRNTSVLYCYFFLFDLQKIATFSLFVSIHPFPSRIRAPNRLKLRFLSFGILSDFA
jgi:hypothetical protein